MRHAPTAVLIIRAWTEPESSQPLRAHIRSSTDVSAGFERAINVADPKQVRAFVDAWLRTISAG